MLYAVDANLKDDRGDVVLVPVQRSVQLQGLPLQQEQLGPRRIHQVKPGQSASMLHNSLTNGMQDINHVTGYNRVTNRGFHNNILLLPDLTLFLTF